LLVWDGIVWLFRGTNIVHNAKTCPGRDWRPVGFRRKKQ
jgi:hypothetical protein